MIIQQLEPNYNMLIVCGHDVAVVEVGGTVRL